VNEKGGKTCGKNGDEIVEINSPHFQASKALLKKTVFHDLSFVFTGI